MKKAFSLLTVLFLIAQGFSQYYYKDILVPKQSAGQWKSLKKNNIKSVKLSSFESNDQPTEGFSVEQNIFDDFGRIQTSTKSLQNGASDLTAWYNANGQLTRTVDTSEDYNSITTYTYDNNGKILTINNTSSSAAQITTTEAHEWKYNAHGQSETMLRIRNGNDTTVFRFVLDDKGNVVEEHGVRKVSAGQDKVEPTVYYYYDDKNRLTDIVRYNMKAQRLLPTNIFSYDAAGNIAGMLLVPEGTNDYQRWFYDYDERGLKTRERVYNKQQQLMGKIEYQYQ